MNETIRNRVLLIGVFGMELVECGGALLNNANAGGENHTIILFASDDMQEEVSNAAKRLGTAVEYANFKYHDIVVNQHNLLRLIKVIRQQPSRGRLSENRIFYY